MILPAVFLAALLLIPVHAETSRRSDDAVRESVLRLAAGDVPGARDQAQAAVAADPRSSKALQQLARAAGAALDFPAAEQAASRAMEIEGPTPALLCLRSEARAGRGDFVGALADADKAAGINPGSGKAVLRRAVAKEGLGRPSEEVLGDYRRAAELDDAHAAIRDAAFARLAPSGRPRSGLGALLGLLAASGVIGWAWARAHRPPQPDVHGPAPRPVLPGSGKISSREALRALSKAVVLAPGPEETFALAVDLYERLTGRRHSTGAGLPGLPPGMDAFFARALHADPERRFRSGEELLGAFRSIVDPAVD